MNPFLKIAFFAVATLLAGFENEDFNSNHLHDVEKKINFLQLEKEKLEKEALNEEIESQGAMRENYSEFAKELLSSEEREKEVRRIEKEIEQLEREKEMLKAEEKKG